MFFHGRLAFFFYEEIANKEIAVIFLSKCISLFALLQAKLTLNKNIYKYNFKI